MTLEELLASPDYTGASVDDRMLQINEWGRKAKEDFPDDAHDIDVKLPQLRAKEYMAAKLPSLGLDPKTSEQFNALYGAARAPKSNEREDVNQYYSDWSAKQKALMGMPDDLRTKYHGFRQILDAAGKHFQDSQQAAEGYRTNQIDFGDGVSIPIATRKLHDRSEMVVTYPDGTNESFYYTAQEAPPDRNRLLEFMVDNRRERLGDWTGRLSTLRNLLAHAGNAAVEQSISGAQFGADVAQPFAGGDRQRFLLNATSHLLPLFVTKEKGPDGEERWVKRSKNEFFPEMSNDEWERFSGRAAQIATGNLDATPEFMESLVKNKDVRAKVPKSFSPTGEAAWEFQGAPEEGIERPAWMDATLKDQNEFARRLAMQRLGERRQFRESFRPYDVDPGNLLSVKADQLRDDGWLDWLGDNAFNVPTVGQVIGSSAPTLAAGMVGGAPAMAPFAALMGASEGNQAYEDVLQRNLQAGVSPDAAQERAMAAGVAYGAIATVLEQAGSVYELKAFRGTLGKTRAGRFLLPFLPESSEETAQSIAQDLISNAEVPDEVKKKAKQIASDSLRAGASALSFGILPGLKGVMTSTPANRAAADAMANPNLPPEAKAAVQAATDLAGHAQNLAAVAQQAAAKASQKPQERKAEPVTPVTPAEPMAATPTVDTEQQARAAVPITYSDETMDAVFQNGAWTLPDGSPAPNAAELESQRQQYIQTGDMPEGMQEAAPVETPTVQPQVQPQPAVAPTRETETPITGEAPTNTRDRILSQVTPEEAQIQGLNDILAQPEMQSTPLPGLLAVHEDPSLGGRRQLIFVNRHAAENFMSHARQIPGLTYGYNAAGNLGVVNIRDIAGGTTLTDKTFDFRPKKAQAAAAPVTHVTTDELIADEKGEEAQAPQVTKSGGAVQADLTNSVAPIQGLNTTPQGGITLEPGYAYREVTQPEIDHLHAEGLLLPDPTTAGNAKKPQRQTKQKMFSVFNPNLPKAGYGPTKLVLRVPVDKVPTNTTGRAVEAADVQVMKDGKWVSVQDAAEPAKQSQAQPSQTVEPTTEPTHATPEQQEQSSPPAQREGGNKSREAPEAGSRDSVLSPTPSGAQEVTPPTSAVPVVAESTPTTPAKEKRSRIGRKKTPAQQAMTTRAFKENPEVANDIISQIKEKIGNFLTAPRIVVQKEKGKPRKLVLAPEYHGGEWNWFEPLLEDPAALAVLHDTIFRENEGQSDPGNIDRAAAAFGMTGNDLGYAIADAAQKRARIADGIAKGQSMEAHEEGMQKAEEQTTAFEEATKKGKGKTLLSTAGMEPGEVFEVDGEAVTVTDVDPETGDVTLRDGTKFGRQILASGEEIWVERPKGEAPDAQVMPFSLAEENDFKESIRAAWDRYDDTGELTHAGLVNEIDAIIPETSDPRAADLQDAVDTYRQEQEDDRALAGRGDMEAAEERFNEAIRRILSSDEPPGPNPVMMLFSLAEPDESGRLPANDRPGVQPGDGSHSSVVSGSPEVVARHFHERIIPAAAKAHGIQTSLGPAAEGITFQANANGDLVARIPKNLAQLLAPLTPDQQKAWLAALHHDMGIMSALRKAWEADPKGDFTQFVKDISDDLTEHNANQQTIKDLREEAIRQGAISPEKAKALRKANSRPQNLEALRVAAVSDHPFAPTIRKRLQDARETQTAANEALTSLLQQWVGRPITERNFRQNLGKLTQWLAKSKDHISEWVHFVLSRLYLSKSLQNVTDPRMRQTLEAVREMAAKAREGKLGTTWQTVVREMDAASQNFQAGTAELKNLHDMQKREAMADRSGEGTAQPATPTPESQENAPEAPETLRKGFLDAIKDLFLMGSVGRLPSLEGKLTDEEDAPVGLVSKGERTLRQRRAERTAAELGGMRFSTPTRRVIAKGVTANDVKAAQDALHQLLPNASTAWVGTLKELQTYLRANKAFQTQWKDKWMAITGKSQAEANKAFTDMVDHGLKDREGFTFGRRTYLITDEIRTLETDGSAANAVRRVLVHEDAHEGLEHLRAIDPDVETAWQGFRNAIPAEELDKLAEKYTWLADWRDSSRLHDDIANEWFARRMEEAERRGKPDKGSLVARFMDWLKGIVGRLTGNRETVTDRALVDFMEAARASRFRDDAERFADGQRFSIADSEGNIPPRRAIEVQIADEQPRAEKIQIYNTWKYNLWSKRRRSAYDSYLNNKDIPADLRTFAQFLGNPTTNPRIKQELEPMVEYARSKLGGIFGDQPEVTDENTEKAMELAKGLLTQRTLASRFQDEFRRFISQWDTSGRPLHRGDAVGAVLQMELMDYATRLAGLKGDIRLMSMLYPYANDMILGDYLTMSGAARALQVRSHAVKDSGAWTSLRLTYSEMDKMAKQAVGAQAVDALTAAIDTSSNKELADDVVKAAVDAVEASVNGKAVMDAVEKVDEKSDEYESEGYWDRVLSLFEGEERADLYAFWQTLSKLDRNVQLIKQLESRIAGNELQSSLAEDADKFGTTPEEIRKGIEKLKAEGEAHKKELMRLLGKLTDKDTSSESKEKRTKIIRDPRVKHAVKALSENKQAAQMIERFKNRNKRLKRDRPAWRKTFEEQVKNPKSEEDFTRAITADGIGDAMAHDLYLLANQLHGERAAKKKPGASSAKTPDQIAQAEVEKYRKEIEATEEKEAKALAKIAAEHKKKREKADAKLIADLQKEAERERKNADRFRKEMDAAMDKYRKAITGNYTQPNSERLRDLERRLKGKEITQAEFDAAVKAEGLEGAPPKRTDVRAFIATIARKITEASIQEQEDPAWKLATITEAFRERGFTAAEAPAAAAKLMPIIDKVFREGQAKSAIRAMKAINELGNDKKIDPIKLGEAIRTRGIDPLNPNPIVKYLAEQKGFKAITPEQFKRLAQLDAKVNSGGPTEAALAYGEMLKIMAAVSPRKNWKQIVTQMYINDALAGSSVLMLNWLHPVYVAIRRPVQDLMMLLADVGSGKTKAADALTIMGLGIQNWINAMRGFAAEASFAFKNDVYRNHMLEVLSSKHRMVQEWRDSIEKIKNGTPAEKMANLAKFTATGTDIVRRLLASADQAWGGVLQQYVVQNEALRTLVQKGGMSIKQAALALNSAHRAGENEMKRQISLGTDKAQSILMGKDRMQSELLQAVDKAVSDKTGESEAGAEVLLTGQKEATMELGNRGREDAPWQDIPSFLLEGVKGISAEFRRKNELLGRMLVGFVTVGSNILNRSLYFTPVGIMRALYKMDKLPGFLGNKELIDESYEETMATEGQQRMRLLEGIAGTLFTLLLAALRRPSDDDKANGIVVTGAGPANKGVKDGWIKHGHKEFHVEIVVHGTVVASISYGRGGFDHLSIPLTFVGAIDDMHLDGKKGDKKNASMAWAYASTMIKDVASQARFFGIKNLVETVPTALSEKSIASNVTYMSTPFIPFSGFVRSVTSMIEGPQDQSSVESAIIAQLPGGPLIAGKPQLNALGDPVGFNSRNLLTNIGERLHFGGMPFFIGIDPDGKDAQLYKFMYTKGVAPSLPSRSTIEAANGFITDRQWERYQKIRGASLKEQMRDNLSDLRGMTRAEAQEEMSDYSRKATREAKEAMGLE